MNVCVSAIRALYINHSMVLYFSVNVALSIQYYIYFHSAGFVNVVG